MPALTITKTTTPKQKPKDESKLGFGRVFTDHMFCMDYEEGKGWHDARIVPYGPISLEPSALVLHYSQTIFEGMKAYRNTDGEIQLFRPMENFKRLNLSAERLCIPRIDEAFALSSLKQLLDLEKDWVPKSDGTSLYIRPFIIATDPFVGVAVGKQYTFYIILSPVGAYYAEGLKPVSILVEDQYVRAVRGGMGYAKTGGNYAASLIADASAQKKGAAQVLWLDGCEHQYIEEVGAMNIFFKIDDVIVTPAINGSILAGITRKSVIELLQSKNIAVEERKISIEELYQAYQEGKVQEVFGTGTAAVISPVGTLFWEDKEMRIGDGTTGETSQMLYDTLYGIQTGKVEDTLHWVEPIV